MENLLAWLNGERGRRLALAAYLNISSSALSMWKNVPPHRVRAVEKFTDIPRVKLRPDIYEDEAA
jgi:DNA-binding transcriptional regulator YdaS (Cro superfamily)